MSSTIVIDPRLIDALNALRAFALGTAEAHGFKEASVGEDIALMHSELSEALEDYRAGRSINEVYYEVKTSPGQRFTANECSEILTLNPEESFKPCGIPSEMADVIIRVLHFCGKHNIDIGKAVIEKMEYNHTRPFKHGGKKL